VKVGDLARLKNTTTGDWEWQVKLWRERIPVLVTWVGSTSDRAEIIFDGKRRIVPLRRLALWEMEGH